MTPYHVLIRTPKSGTDTLRVWAPSAAEAIEKVRAVVMPGVVVLAAVPNE